MAQITWRNVNAPSFAGSNQAAQAGSESISRGLASLGTLAQQEGKRRKDVNTGELLREIQGLDTAGLTEARSSGQFGADALEGQNVDEGALFAALKGQDAAIAKQATDVFNRENATRTQSDAPILAASQAELAGISDPKQIAAYTAKLGESGLSSQAQTQMLNAAKAAETSLVNKGRSEETYIRSQDAQVRADEKRIEDEETDAFNLNILRTQQRDTPTVNEASSQIAGITTQEGITDFRNKIPELGVSPLAETKLLNQLQQAGTALQTKTENTYQLNLREGTRTAQEVVNEIISKGNPDPNVVMGEIANATSNLPPEVGIKLQQQYTQVREKVGKTYSTKQSNTLATERNTQDRAIKFAESTAVQESNAAIRTYPIDTALTEKAEIDANVSVGSILAQLQESVPNVPFDEEKSDTGGAYIGGRFDTMEKEYLEKFGEPGIDTVPGWQFKEALALTGVKGLDDATFAWDRSIDFEKVQKNLFKLADRYKKNRNNQAKLDAKLLQINERMLNKQSTSEGSYRALENQYINNNTANYYKSRNR